MGAPLGRETDTVAFYAALSSAPYQHDFYQTLRRLECLFADRPRWGEALRPLDERVRFGQDPELAFAPAPIASFDAGDAGGRPRLQVRLFGLLGPNGPLPLHLTEYARERLRNAGDPTLSRFLDLFHHRFLTLFYRAWAQAQPHVNRDRPDTDHFGTYVGSFFGVAPGAFRERDSLPDVAKLFHVGALVRQARNADGLAAILEHYFRVPVRIEQFVGHWLRLDDQTRTRLGRENAVLGRAVVAGRQVWDRQHKFRLRVGPLTLAQYESFLPAPRRGSVPQPGEGVLLRQLVDWVRLYFSFELDWDVCLLLRHDQVPKLTLGRAGRLGWTTWVGRRRGERPADDLCLHAEAFVTGAGEAAV
jgi:type VI secretion system protein ImpH